MKRNNVVYALAFAVAVMSVGLPIFAAGKSNEETVEETEASSNGSKMKKGAKDFFEGLKGTVKDGANTAKEKAKALTQESYVGEWYFCNGKYSTLIELESDWDFKITQTKKIGENEWSGTYEEGDGKGQLVLHLVTANGNATRKDWKIKYNAEKKDYIIISSDDLNDDPNGYDFTNRTLFNYVGK